MSQSMPPSTPASAAGGAATDQVGSGITPAPALEAALAELETAARQLEGQPQALLALLRSIEQLHRSIQDGPFRASLPADRNALFQLLSEMERSGGWPYIPRLQLRTFLDLLGQGDAIEGLSAALPSAVHEAPGEPPAASPRMAA